MKILRLRDRVKLTVKDVSFLLSPLSVSHKAEIASLVTNIAGKQNSDMIRSSLLSLKYSVKGVKGLKTVGGEDYKLDFEEDNESLGLTDECAEELMNLNLKD